MCWSLEAPRQSEADPSSAPNCFPRGWWLPCLISSSKGLLRGRLRWEWDQAWETVLPIAIPSRASQSVRTGKRKLGPDVVRAGVQGSGVEGPVLQLLLGHVVVCWGCLVSPLLGERQNQVVSCSMPQEVSLPAAQAQPVGTGV